MCVVAKVNNSAARGTPIVKVSTRPETHNLVLISVTQLQLSSLMYYIIEHMLKNIVLASVTE